MSLRKGYLFHKMSRRTRKAAQTCWAVLQVQPAPRRRRQQGRQEVLCLAHGLQVSSQAQTCTHTNVSGTCIAGSGSWNQVHLLLAIGASTTQSMSALLCTDFCEAVCTHTARPGGGMGWPACRGGQHSSGAIYQRCADGPGAAVHRVGRHLAMPHGGAPHGHAAADPVCPRARQPTRPARERRSVRHGL